MGPGASTATISWLPTTYTWSKRFPRLHSLLVSPRTSSGVSTGGVAAPWAKQPSRRLRKMAARDCFRPDKSGHVPGARLLCPRADERGSQPCVARHLILVKFETMGHGGTTFCKHNCGGVLNTFRIRKNYVQLRVTYTTSLSGYSPAAPAANRPRHKRKPPPRQAPQAMIARIRGDHDTRWGRWRPERDPRIERYAGPKYGSPAARATGCAEAVGRVAVRSRRGVDRRCVGRGGRIVLVHSGPSTAAGDAASVAGRVRGSGDRQPCPGVRGALRAAARSGLRERAAFKLQDVLQPHHQPLCRGSASLCRRAHCGARAARDGAPARLGGRAQPSASGLAGRRSSRRQLGALAMTTASRTRVSELATCETLALQRRWTCICAPACTHGGGPLVAAYVRLRSRAAAAPAFGSAAPQYQSEAPGRSCACDCTRHGAVFLEDAPAADGASSTDLALD